MIVCIAGASGCAGWTFVGGEYSKQRPRIIGLRCQQKVTEPAPDTGDGSETSQKHSTPGLRSIAAVAIVAAAAGATAPPSAAREEWLPRRHWRRLDEPRQRSVDMYTPVKVKPLAMWWSFCRKFGKRLQEGA